MITPLKQFVDHRNFEYFILSVIFLNGIVIGLETSNDLYAQYGPILHFIDRFVLGIFIIEALLKITAEAPRVDRYFRQGWNIFDFSLIVLSFLPTGQFATTARLVRILRLARVVTLIPELRLIIATLLRSLPGMFHIVILLSVLFYIYAIIGFYLFHQADSQHWGNLGASLLSLFGIVTLEGWVDMMRAVLHVHPLVWVYFVSFIVVGTFMFINLFVAVVINNLAEAKEEKLQELAEAAGESHGIMKGIYEHYKGKRYEVVDVARHSETTELVVVYKALYRSEFPEGSLWVRPLGMFQEEVIVDGKKVPRFRRIK